MRKLRQNKKAQEFFTPILAFVFILLLFMVLRSYSGKQSTINLEFIGKNQIVMKSRYEQAENDLFFNDQLAKYASWNAIYNLANQGGFESVNYPQHLGYLVINPFQNIPDYEENFEKLFAQNFNQKFKAYFNKELNYTISIRNDLVAGITTDVLDYKESIAKDGIIDYSIKPHFEIKLDYNFSDYDTIMENSKKLINNCHDKAQLKDCITKEIQNFQGQKSLTWRINGCQGNVPILGKKVAFCVFHKPQKNIYTQDGFKPLLYKFTLEFKK